MVAKGDILTAKQEIEVALGRFVGGGAATKVFVFETQWQHLRALIGSDGFRTIEMAKRQKMVWEYLEEHASKEALQFLVAVHPMDLDEYDKNVREV